MAPNPAARQSSTSRADHARPSTDQRQTQDQTRLDCEIGPQRCSHRWGGTTPDRIPIHLVKTASWTICAPSTVAAAMYSSEWMPSPRKPDSPAHAAARQTQAGPRPAAQSGVEKQPARAEQQQETQVAPAVAPGAQVRRAVAAVGRSVVGTSPIRSPASAALTTISLANSMPGVTRPSRRMASREKPRRPQWKSPIGMRKNSRPDEAQHRVAQVAVQRTAWRPAAMPPSKRLPITRSAPARSRSTIGARGGEVVAVVGVAHDDVAAARGLMPAISAAP